jgi:TPR repeat protein
MTLHELRELIKDGSSTAKLIMAFLLDNGFLKDELENNAIRLYEDVALDGDPIAQLELSKRLALVEDQANRKKAFEWCSKAASQQLAAAELQLAKYYSQGIGTTQDYLLAKKYTELAAEHGSGEAYYELGYACGCGEQYLEAMSYYEKGAKLGSHKSAYHVAKIYEKGIGVQINKDLALKYYKLAAALGSFIAHQKLVFVYKEGTLNNKVDNDKVIFHRAENDRLFKRAIQEGAL